MAGSDESIVDVDKGINNADFLYLTDNTYSYSGYLTTEEYGIINNIYKTIAKDISVIEFKHLDHTKALGYDDTINYLLNKRPNALQTPGGMMETLVYNIMRYGNGIIIPKYTGEYEEVEVEINGTIYTYKEYKGTKLDSLEVLDVSQIEFGFGYKEIDGEIYMVWKRLPCTRYRYNQYGHEVLNDDEDYDYNELYIYPYKEIIHIRREDVRVFVGDWYPEFNSSIQRLIDGNISNILNQLTSSGTFNGLLKIKSGMVAESKRIAKLTSFMNQMKSKTGIAVLDANEDFKELTKSFSKINKEDIDYSVDMIYDLFGVNKNIIQGTYTNAEYEAYYNKTLLPLINKIQQELEYKLLTKNQVIKGHKIIPIRNFFIGANIQELGTFMDKAIYHGIFSPNEIRVRLGESPREDGDKYYTNANAVEVSESLKGGDG